MAEEQTQQRCQEGHRLCANDCGFFGSPGTMNLCSKCYRDFCLKEEQASSAKIAVEKSLQAPSPSPSASSSVVVTAPTSAAEAAGSASPAAEEERKESAAAAVPAAAVQAAMPAVQAAPAASRCWTCRKKVGLTGFKCRCGSTYCGAHRYPEQHACGFDFKAAGREAIARANPVVKADKLDKI